MWSWVCLFGEKAWGSPVLPYWGSPNSSKQAFCSISLATADKMKQFELISSNVSESWKQRVIFATVAFGMVVNSPCVEKIIHFGVPELWRVFFKKVGELEEMGDLLHQLFTSATIILVQRLKECNLL